MKFVARYSILTSGRFPASESERKIDAEMCSNSKRKQSTESFGGRVNKNQYAEKLAAWMYLSHCETRHMTEASKQNAETEA
jgi:hypothetical protein